MKPMLSGLIAGHLQKRWAQDEPSDKCFDHDDLTMARLLAFIDGTANDPDKREVRTHLLQCPRCRFIFAKMRAVTVDNPRGSGSPIGGCPRRH